MMKAAPSLPEWLKDEDLEPGDDVPLKPIPVSHASIQIPATNSAAESSQQVEPGSIGINSRIHAFHWALRIITMLLCLLMVTTSVVGLGMISGVDNLGRIFVAVYMFFFATLLFAFELNQVKQFEIIDHMFKRNFGFLYSYMGRAFYLIFIAFLSFGLGKPEMLSFCTGLIFALFGGGQLALYLKYPELFE